jgi:hypothetical protein
MDRLSRSLLIRSLALVAVAFVLSAAILLRLGDFDPPPPPPPIPVDLAAAARALHQDPPPPGPVDAPPTELPPDPPPELPVSPFELPVIAPPPPPPAPPPDRRLPIGGAKGYNVVIRPDGSAALESPDGESRSLAAAPEPTVPAPGVPPVTQERARRPEDGQIVVLEAGVVSVPRDAVITYTGRDRLVTHQGDGSSIVYHADGRVERRDRPSRVDSAAAQAADQPPGRRQP